MNASPLSVIGTVPVVIVQASFGEELNEQQQEAVRLLENRVPCAVGALKELKTGKFSPADLGWDYYQKWMITPTNQALDACRKAKVPADAELLVAGRSMTYAEVEEQAAGIEAEFKAAFARKPDRLRYRATVAMKGSSHHNITTQFKPPRPRRGIFARRGSCFAGIRSRFVHRLLDRFPRAADVDDFDVAGVLL
jgi:hypothetical protein